MPVLPLVDLLILLGTVILAIGFVLKAIVVTTVYYPTVMGFASSDFVLITGVCFGFAMVLIARTWLKLIAARRPAPSFATSLSPSRPRWRSRASSHSPSL